MGIGASRNKTPNTPIPQYNQPGTALPPYNISRPASPATNQRQQRQLNEAYQTIQRIQNQMAMQSGGAPIMSAPPPIPSLMGPNSYPPPSPLLQRITGRPSYGYQQQQQQQVPVGNGVFRDTDYAAVANIAGLNPADVAILHREYVNVTRGGTNRLDRVVFSSIIT